MKKFEMEENGLEFYCYDTCLYSYLHPQQGAEIAAKYLFVENNRLAPNGPKSIYVEVMNPSTDTNRRVEATTWFTVEQAEALVHKLTVAIVAANDDQS